MTQTQLKAAEVTPQLIKELVGSSLDAHEFDVDNGAKIYARTKVTVRAGLVNTAYLHLSIHYPSGKKEHYREHADGVFRTK